MARPADVPVEELQVTGADNWGARWGTMVRTLEAAAPCIYIPNYDWRHSCVAPALSGRVAVVGLLHDDGPLYAEHATRLGDYWNAVVATSRQTARHLRQVSPRSSNRMCTIQHGVRVPTALGDRAWGGSGGTLLIPPETCGGGVLSFIRAIVESGRGWSIVAVDPPEADREWLAAAGVRLAIRPGRLAWLELCASSHAVVIAGSDPATRPPVVEAMAHGCVPVTVGSESPDSSAGRRLRDTGITVPDGRRHGAVGRLQALGQDADKWKEMAAAAHRMARETAFRSDQMIAEFLDLFQHVCADADSGFFARRRGAVLPPPAGLTAPASSPSR